MTVNAPTVKPNVCPSCGSHYLPWYAGKLRCTCGQTWTWNVAAQAYLLDGGNRED